MRPAGYADDDIIKAGRSIQESHPDRPITASAIRSVLGGGNLARIRRV